MGARKTRKPPGRPEGVSGSREIILKAARGLFAERGYAGTSMKVISDAAGVTTALITYYFETKQNLHQEIYLQTAGKIGAMRIARLNALKASGAGVKDVVSAFLQPLLEVVSTEEGRAFLLFQWRVDSEEQELSFSLRHQAYDASTHAYAEALCALLPDLGRAACYARLASIIGATSYAVSGRHRLDSLLPGMSPETGTLLMLQHLNENAYRLFA